MHLFTRKIAIVSMQLFYCARLLSKVHILQIVAFVTLFDVVLLQ